MTAYSALLHKLNLPYPQPFAPAAAFRKALTAGAFVALLNLVFQPFGLAAYQHSHKPWVLTGFGVPVVFWVTMLGVVLPWAWPRFRYQQRQNWSVWKQLLANNLITVFITATIYVYARWVGFAPFASVTYLVVCSFSFAMLVSLFFVFSDHNARLSESDRRATQESADLKLLLRESHHRMRNHLQVIASVLRLQTNSVTDAKALDALRTSEKRLESIAILHEKLYQNENVSQVDLCGYLEELTRIVARHHAELIPNVAIRVQNRAAISVSLDTAVPLGLIVNELITNSFKHAFVHMDQCVIDLILDQADDGRHRLTIRDNGPGVPGGLNPAGNGTSLGLRLIKALTQQLRAQLSYRHNGGAEFVVQF